MGVDAMLYNAHAARGWLAEGIPVVKSHWHSDGEPCFGGGWFIVTAQLPSGQVSNHYRDEFWGLFDVPEVALPPEYDGHTPADASKRLSDALAAPPARPPVDVEAALDEWLGDEDCWPEHDEFGAQTGAVASDREGLLNLLRTVTTPSEPLTLAQLEELPVGSVVLDDRELSWQTDESGMWTRLDWRCTSGDMLIGFGPVRLLHTGTVTTREDGK